MARALVNLPQVARAKVFAEEKAPAVLLVPEERISLYRGLSSFGVRVYLRPSAYAKDEVAHFVMGFEGALEEVPADPLAEGLVFEVGKSYPRASLLDQLERLGYRRDEEVWVRGDVVEVAGARLEFFGPELERIEVEGEGLERFRLKPSEKAEPPKLVPLITLFPGPVYIEQPSRAPETLWALLEEREKVFFAPFPGAKEERPAIEPLAPYRAEAKRMRADIERWLAEGYRVVFFYKHEKGRDYLLKTHFKGLPTKVAGEVRPFEGVLLVPGAFEGGFLDPGEKAVYLTEALLYGFSGASAVRRTFFKGEAVSDPELLSVGDYLIHPEHGIGRFEGLITREVLGAKRDYLVLKYRDQGRLYVPVEDLPLLRRHPATSDGAIEPRQEGLEADQGESAKIR